MMGFEVKLLIRNISVGFLYIYWIDCFIHRLIIDEYSHLGGQISLLFEEFCSIEVSNRINVFNKVARRLNIDRCKCLF